MAGSDPQAILDEAILRTEEAGWRLVTRDHERAEFEIPGTPDRLYLWVSTSGVVHTRQSGEAGASPGQSEPQPLRSQTRTLDWESSELIAAAVGAGLVFVGSLLPWVSVRVGLVQLSVAGTDGDGKISLVLGAIAAAIVLVLLLAHAPEGSEVPLRVVVLILGSIAAAIAFYDGVNLGDAFSRARSRAAANFAAVDARIGAGIYIVLRGG